MIIYYTGHLIESQQKNGYVFSKNLRKDEFRGAYLWFALFLYGIMCVGGTYTYIGNIIEHSVLFEKIASIIKTPPEVCFSIQCYHMERKTWTEKDA